MVETDNAFVPSREHKEELLLVIQHFVFHWIQGSLFPHFLRGKNKIVQVVVPWTGLTAEQFPEKFWNPLDLVWWQWGKNLSLLPHGWWERGQTGNHEDDLIQIVRGPVGLAFE